MFWLLLAFIGLSFVFGLFIIAQILVFRRAIATREAQLMQSMQEWVEAPNPETPSRLAILTDAIGQTIGQATARSLMASLRAEQSHVARVANGMSDEIQAQQNPIIALLAGGRRGKNSAVMKLAEMLMPMLQQSRGNSANPESAYQRKHHD